MIGLSRSSALTHPLALALAVASVNAPSASPACWIAKHPDVSFDRESTEREWVIDVADIQPFTGGN